MKRDNLEGKPQKGQLTLRENVYLHKNCFRTESCGEISKEFVELSSCINCVETLDQLKYEWHEEESATYHVSPLLASLKYLGK